MSTEGIISIIITLILGIPSLIALFRINQTKIVYLEKQLINLKDDLLKNFDDLSIKYKGIEVEKNIYFISGFFICQGKKDISNENNIVELTIPENSKWLDYKIVSKSKGIIINKTMDEYKVSLDFDLFKNKEFIEYEGIIEINEEIKYPNQTEILEFHHRIPNIPAINKFNIETLKSSLVILITSILLAFLPLTIAYDYNNIGPFSLKTYNTETDKELSSYTVYKNKGVETLKEKIIKEKSGFVLFFDGKTENFPVKVIDINGKTSTKLKSVYFKMNDWSIMDWIFSFILCVFFAFSIIGTIVSIKLLYYKKRYLKLINK